MIKKSPLRRYLPTLLVGLTLAASGIALNGWTLAARTGAPSITHDLAADAKFLASEQLMGRGVGTPGIDRARDYIAAKFAAFGLQPAGDNGGYLQSFDVAVGVSVKPPTELRLGSQALAINEEWVPLGLSASGKATAELVFVGYGITAKEHGYDDYEGIDVKGKVVLVMRYEPPPRDGQSPFKNFPQYSIHAALRTKANNARDHGAAAMILVDLGTAGRDKAELLSTGGSLWRAGTSLLAAQVKREVVERPLAERGVLLPALKERIDREGRPSSMPLSGMSVALEVNLTELRRSAQNVVAVLAGSQPSLSDEHIVIGAHYDHLGLGHYGARDSSVAGTIHPGADDNASGTAVLIEVARRLAQLPVAPARTVIFAAFSAEELGLFGSRHFVNNTKSITTTKAMINLDMVGRLRDNRVTVFGARSGQNLSQIVAAAAERGGFDLIESDDVGRSDHLSFYNKRVPVLHFFTGIHEDYHRPTDTPEKLNIDGMARIGDLVMATVVALADARPAINFVSLPLRRPPAPLVAGSGSSTYLGSIPAYGGTTAGVELAGVSDGSPAALAGLRSGDVIVRLADKKIQNIEDLTVALQAQKPGDEVAILVLRAGHPIELKATLRARGPALRQS
jgi:Zn-dependent M28 family amino/carboxypeptidase